ncbi:hypothetical protein BD410DRAFT_392843 [Rickenella mellea]|uniref:Uncharacterized protein n=1 Tax=Rickenella mellea TaxID=50990 RepID=A0A4Y7PY15_9AGAM|nr:hypothetical protein BD410DRAFT_392843 [Rickenella mellea]
MLPLFHNPHLIGQQCQATTRSEVFGGLHEATELLDNDSLGDVLEDVVRLETILKSSLDVNVEGQEQRPKKKRKITSESSNPPTSTGAHEFVLVSTQVSPRLIQVNPRPMKSVKPIELSYEDDETEATTRKHRAQTVSVDYSWLIHESQMVYPTFKKRPCLNLESGISNPIPILVTERLVPSSSQFPKSTNELGRVHCCPVVAAATPQHDQRKRRRRKRANRPIILPPRARAFRTS